MSHELRNPLGVMSNALYFLKNLQPDADDMVKEYLDIIRQEIENAGRIITDILNFSQTRTPKIMPTEPYLLVSRSLEKCPVPENISISVTVPESLPLLKVDPQQMDQVMHNLISNAFQAMPDGGVLCISARAVSGSGPELPVYEENNLEKGSEEVDSLTKYVEILVVDTGEGISPENMKKLFQPLFTTKLRGIGLGLTLCRNFTETNGWHITAASQPGEGTTFCLTLPVMPGS